MNDDLKADVKAIIGSLRKAIAAGPKGTSWIHLSWDRFVYTRLSDGCRGTPVVTCPEQTYPGEWQPMEQYATLNYVAHANPENVTALLDHVERLEAERDALRKDAERWKMLPAFASEHQINLIRLFDDIYAALAQQAKESGQ